VFAAQRLTKKSIDERGALCYTASGKKEKLSLTERACTVKSNDAHADRSHGFTLIELLTVIFIIGLLAAILIPAVSRARMTAKVGAAEADLRSLATALSDYQIDHATLPPMAGCPVRDIDPGHPTFVFPYIARLGLIDQEMRPSFYDRWSSSEDLNANLALDGIAEDRPQFRVINTITKEGVWELNEVLDRRPVPYQYFPVNSNNLRKFRQWLAANNPDDPRADGNYDISVLTAPIESGGAGIPALTDGSGNVVGFNTPFYDRFVVFSLGPDQTDHDIIPRNATSMDELRLRAYYRATLDLNNNDALDFNYRDRIKRTETTPLPDFGRPYKRGDAGIIILVGP